LALFRMAAFTKLSPSLEVIWHQTVTINNKIFQIRKEKELTETLIGQVRNTLDNEDLTLIDCDILENGDLVFTGQTRGNIQSYLDPVGSKGIIGRLSNATGQLDWAIQTTSASAIDHIVCTEHGYDCFSIWVTETGRLFLASMS